MRSSGAVADAAVASLISETRAARVGASLKGAEGSFALLCMGLLIPVLLLVAAESVVQERAEDTEQLGTLREIARRE